MITHNSKIFYVEFGEPDTLGMVNLGPNNNPRPLFVIADSYDEAVNKALCYVQDNHDADAALKGVLDEMGNVKSQFLGENKKEFTVKSVKMVSNNIIV